MIEEHNRHELFSTISLSQIPSFNLANCIGKRRHEWCFKGLSALKEDWCTERRLIGSCGDKPRGGLRKRAYGCISMTDFVE